MLSKTLIVSVCALLVFFGCTHFVDGALRKDVTDDGIIAQVDDVRADVGPADSVRAGTVQGNAEADIDDDSIDRDTGAFMELYGPIIKQYAERYGLDWRLVLATMKQESGFSTTAVSHRGAMGLMQIMPVTSEELSRIFNVEDISHPNDNIRGGVYYLRKLYNLFPEAEEGDRIRLALAAYNAGIGRIYDAQELAAHLDHDPMVWESVKSALPLLSPSNQELHRSVWSQDRPRCGWFRNPGETLKYVENVMNNYDEYRLMFN